MERVRTRSQTAPCAIFPCSHPALVQVQLSEWNVFETELQLFEPLCIVITHVLTTTGDTAVTKIPERRLEEVAYAVVLPLPCR